MALLMNRKVVYAFNEMGLRRARSRGRKKKKKKKKKQKKGRKKEGNTSLGRTETQRMLLQYHKNNRKQKPT